MWGPMAEVPQMEQLCRRRVVQEGQTRKLNCHYRLPHIQLANDDFAKFASYLFVQKTEHLTDTNEATL